MEKLNVVLCIIVDEVHWRKNILGYIQPTRGMGYRFNVMKKSEFHVKVKFVYCDVDQPEDQVEGEVSLVWAEANLPKHVTIRQIEEAGFEKWGH